MFDMKYWEPGTGFNLRIKELVGSKRMLYIGPKLLIPSRTHEWPEIDGQYWAFQATKNIHLTEDLDQFDYLVIEELNTNNMDSRVNQKIKDIIKYFIRSNKDVIIRLSEQACYNKKLNDEIGSELDLVAFKKFCDDSKASKKQVTVGRLREATALCDTDRKVVIVSDDPELKALGLKVVEVYPDTTDEHGDWDSTFKIKVSM